MALIKCKDCKKEFSTDAKRCPHCGATKLKRFRFRKFLFSGAGIFFLLVFIAVLTMPKQAVDENSIDWPPRPNMPAFSDRVFIKAQLDTNDVPQPRVIGYTNLPDGMKLGIELRRRNMFTASEFTIVSGGRFFTKPMSYDGNQEISLPPGKVELDIISPIMPMQLETVRQITGYNGENLKGDLVKADSGQNYIHYSISTRLGKNTSLKAEREFLMERDAWEKEHAQ